MRAIATSILDLAMIGRGDAPRDALEGSVAIARLAEDAGYQRIWYAEHHNMASIASSATSVVIAHIAACTRTIRLGAGGIMLPNHSPLTIAEQFGTLATLHPGRIELGVGRAPGSDQVTARALRRDPRAVDTFPEDVLELQGYLSGHSRVPGVEAIPGRGTNVPMYVLGSSLYGAHLAAALGLPYAFASHFAPDALREAVAIYRREFGASEQLDRPHVIAAVNVIAADTEAAAQEQLLAVRRRRAAFFLTRTNDCSDEEADRLLQSPQAHHVNQMMHYTAAGTPPMVQQYLEQFTTIADADELIIAPSAPTIEAKLRTLELVASLA
jgi:luciferase family oxidoreductase group 1